MPVGTFDDPAGPPPWSNTPWPKNPPFTPAGAAESQRLNDHSNFTACTPGGPVFHMWEIGLFPIQLLEAPDQIVILREASGIPRRIYTDGRGHPPEDELVATWNGHSIGTWDGDVLVVDTVGTNGRARAANGVGSNAKVSSIDDDPRFPLSDQLHLVERLQLVANGELLEDELTIDDPKFYTERVVLKHYFQRRPDIDMLEYFCGDNPRPRRRHREGDAMSTPRTIRTKLLRAVGDRRAVALALRCAPAAHAHHSFASFDRTKKVTLTGTVKDFQWTNPHAWIQVTVPDDKGQATEWGVECGSPNMMARTGWKKTSLDARRQGRRDREPAARRPAERLARDDHARRRHGARARRRAARRGR